MRQGVTRLLLRLAGAACLLALSALAAVAEPLLDKGAALLNAGHLDEAIAALHDAERRLPDRSQAAGLLGEAYLRLGMRSLEARDEAAAREAFASAKDYLPDDPRPWQGTAIAWLHAGQPAAALGELHEALALAGERPELLVLLGRAHYAAGDLAQAEDAWQKAAELEPAAEVTALLDKVRRERRAEAAMRRDLAGRFTLAYAPGVSDPLAAAVLEVLQDAYADLGRELGYYPDSDIPVLLYAREDFAAVTRSPEWAGAVYDGKIRVPLGGVQRMTDPLKALLYHEYTHVVVRFLAKGRAPVWLNEGLAELIGRRQFDPPPPPPPAGARIDPAALDRSFGDLPAHLVPLAYAQSHARVKRLVELCGWPPLGELLQRLGSGSTWDRAIAQAYAPCGYDWPRLQVELAGELH
ncbi:MAG: tetratricopeptide repeat protein [Deltaproteobacteria bacterium]|nr:MAG: tetratricopeptide repeat protein [Deltaproteobacteria bacterium]